MLPLLQFVLHHTCSAIVSENHSRINVATGFSGRCITWADSFFKIMNEGHIDSGIERCFVKERRQGISNIPRHRLCNCFVAIRLNQTLARYRNVTIWARVHVLSRENVLSVVSAVTPLSNAHCTALTFVLRPALGVCWCHNVPIRLLCILVYRGCLLPAIWQ